MANEPSSTVEKNKFKDTLNLPRTDFPIRPNAKIEDAQLLERWAKEDIYYKTFMLHAGTEKFILHDGPPYANGHLHLGHAYNKILKDIVCKSRRMEGKQVPVTPGWDCHGLPIELKVTKEYPGLSAPELKKKCREYAQQWVDIQRAEFKKLGVLMDWDHPFLTMNFSYESTILRAFGILVKKGYIEKKKKTVPWCPTDQTVLAAAEIEYKDRKDPSVYVQFPLSTETIKRVIPQFKDKKVSLLVWTTTPWTLPLNRAVLMRPKAQYAICEHNGNYIILAEQLVDKVFGLAGIEKKIVGTISADDISGYKVQHPFIKDLEVPIILDQSVGLDEGTAVVHCAPGCGPQDYDVAIKHNLEIFSPISADGRYTKGIIPAELEGMPVSEGQIWVLRTLAANGMLFFKNSITHAYPHCWRCHNGLIFRATNQWFCDLEHSDLRNHALEALGHIQFWPERSVNFLKATLENRLEWCLSRQRVWGVPIPALLCKHCDYAYLTQELIDRVAKGVAKEGIEFWDTVELKDLGMTDLKCPQCYTPEFVKEKDILDVWFESGVSHFAVLLNNPALQYPADIYLEGVDQHRAWFQSSLLTSMILEEKPCTKSFLTHGFTVDEKGHKMSKSLGNVVAPDQIINQLGTDGLRLWVSSINYEGDAIVSETLLRNVAEVYRKIRNTCRFLISNLYDFDITKDTVAFDQMRIIDWYALERLWVLNDNVRAHYKENDFTANFHVLGDYCAVQLSSLYLDIIKDRLYVEAPSGLERRSAQTACWYILDTLTRLMAPILSFTAEHISDYYQKNKAGSIHLQKFADKPNVFEKSIRNDEIWQLLIDIRNTLLKAIEQQREKGIIKHSLEARIEIYLQLKNDKQKLFDMFLKELESSPQNLEEFFKEFLIVSEVSVKSAQNQLLETEMRGVYAAVEPAKGTKCPRCWNWEITEHPDHLCRRCQRVLQAK